MLPKLRESLALLLLTLLPLHALLVTVGTKLIAGPGSAPLPILAIWKEGVLALILLIAAMEWMQALCRPFVARACHAEVRGVSEANEEPRSIARAPQGDTMDLLILLLIGLSLIVSIINYPFFIIHFLHGFRYDFVPLVAFLILRRVPWSDQFKRLLPMLLLSIGAVIAGYGIISFFLPASFFTWLGYSDLHSLYVPDGPVAAFQQIGSTGLRRIQSTMSGPNHLGLWLLIPWSILMGFLLSFISHTKERSKEKITANQITSERAFVGINHNGTTLDCIVELLGSVGQRLYTPRGSRSPSMFVLVVLCVLLGITLLLTFSRAAWIGAIAITIITLLQIVPRAMYAKVLMMCSGLVILFALLLTFTFPTVILRIASSRDHFLRPMEAVRTMINHPLGLGLGSAGPASNRMSDPCVFLEAGSDPSWALDRPNLCVFVADVQVQPIDRTCRCPFLPENWYLQIGVELGVLGFLLFLTLTFLVIRRLMDNGQWIMDNDLKTKCRHYPLSIINCAFAHAAFLSFLAISITALFLHAWEDMAVALTVWIALAVSLPSGTLSPWNSPSTLGPSSSSTLADSTRT